MRFKSPSLTELHAFLAVCRLGSFRQAATDLSVTQAAVSRAVQRLEQHLACTLLDRSGPQVVPTARGREFQALTEAHVAGLEAAMARFGGGAARHRLRVSVVPTLATRWLVPRLAGFHQAHPQVDLELRPFRHDEDFMRDDVDLWIDLKSARRTWPRGLRVRYLWGREIQPACTPALATRLRSAADLHHLPLLHHVNYPNNWALWLQAAGAPQPAPTLGPGFDLGNHLIAAACAGMGAIIIQPALIEAELTAGQLVLPFATTLCTDRGYHLCWHAALDGHAGLAHWCTWLQEQAQASQRRFGLEVDGPGGTAD